MDDEAKGLSAAYLHCLETTLALPRLSAMKLQSIVLIANEDCQSYHGPSSSAYLTADLGIQWETDPTDLVGPHVGGFDQAILVLDDSREVSLYAKREAFE